MQPQGLILLVLFGGLLFLMFHRTRRQQREARNLQTRLTAGSRIMTTAGLYATVVALDTSVVTLETAPGQQSRWDRRAVARIVTEDGPPGEVSADEVTAGAVEDVTADAAASGTEGVASAGERRGHATTPDDEPGTAASPQDTAPPDRA
jgi:preprotein translocase subunit YajC